MSVQRMERSRRSQNPEDKVDFFGPVSAFAVTRKGQQGCPVLWVTRGLPGSVKTSWARFVLQAFTLGTVVRVNRDDLRRMALPAGYREPLRVAEDRITLMQHAAVRSLLEDGCSVICDDTNLVAGHVEALRSIATSAGAVMEVADFTAVPLEQCIANDGQRPEPERVGEAVIRAMHSQLMAVSDDYPGVP